MTQRVSVTLDLTPFLAALGGPPDATVDDPASLVREVLDGIKGLPVLHAAARLLSDRLLEESQVLAALADLLPSAFRFPDDAAARIAVGTVSHATARWADTPWRLRAEFRTGDGRDGLVEVAYRREVPARDDGPFLPEERRLVESLAFVIGGSLGHRRTAEYVRHLVGAGVVRLVDWDLAGGYLTWPGLPEHPRREPTAPMVRTREEALRAIHPDDRQEVERRVDAALSSPTQSTFATAFRVAFPGRDYVWRHLTAHVLRNRAGDPVRVIAVSTDVSEQKALEARVRQAERMEALGRVAAGVCHDFNNVLQAMLSHAEFARNALPEGHPARAELDALTKAGKTGMALTSQVLAFGRQQKLEPHPVDLHGLLRETAPLVKRLLGSRIRLAIQADDDVPRALVDPTQVQQVLLNLATNARDAMPGGGVLTVRLQRARAGLPQRDGTVGEPRDWATIEARDTGTGMAPEVRDRVFEPYFTTKEEGRGTGLGLATVHGIVTQSGGFVEVESQVGSGSRFRVHFPAA
jgi:signal transduction histidine kinase